MKTTLLNSLRSIYHAIKRKDKFENSDQYWKKRYQTGGNSGAGSYGQLALFKAQVINDFALEQGVLQALEFGCGDGNQCSLFKFSKYVGVDISPTIIAQNKQKFASDGSKAFYTYDDFFQQYKKAFDLTLSLDVIYHLIEDSVYHQYMNTLFDYAGKYVIIYSSNFDSKQDSHVRHRSFVPWIESNRKGWKLLQLIPNKYTYDPRDPNNTSSADFYIYERAGV